MDDVGEQELRTHDGHQRRLLLCLDVFLRSGLRILNDDFFLAHRSQGQGEVQERPGKDGIVAMAGQ